MMKDIAKDTILDVSKKLTQNYETQSIMDFSLKTDLPDREVVYSILEDLHKITFPGYFGNEKILSREAFAEGILVSLYEKM